MNRLTPEMLEQVEQAVQGTCFPVEQHFNNCEFGFEFADLNVVERRMLDEYIEEHHFECGVCGWWCETGDWILQKNFVGHEICTSCGEYDPNNEDYEEDE